MPLEEFNETCTNGIRTENLCNHESILQGTTTHSSYNAHTGTPRVNLTRDHTPAAQSCRPYLVALQR